MQGIGWVEGVCNAGQGEAWRDGHGEQGIPPTSAYLLTCVFCMLGLQQLIGRSIVPNLSV